MSEDARQQNELRRKELARENGRRYYERPEIKERRRRYVEERRKELGVVQITEEQRREAILKRKSKSAAISDLINEYKTNTPCMDLSLIHI